MTGTSRQIVCLANSRKLSGRCVAGRIIQINEKPGAWLRPISNREHGEVAEEERRYPDGSDPRVLDLISVPLLEPAPDGYQRENWLINPAWHWLKSGEYPRSGLAALCGRPMPLWLNGHSTRTGLNDQVPLDLAAALDHSLRLVRVESLTLRVFAPGEAYRNAKRRVQARFEHAGDRYALWVTDPIIERRYLAHDDRDYPLGRHYLTISLGEPYNDHCYKLVAALIEPG